MRSSRCSALLTLPPPAGVRAQRESHPTLRAQSLSCPDLRPSPCASLGLQVGPGPARVAAERTALRRPAGGEQGCGRGAVRFVTGAGVAAGLPVAAAGPAAIAAARQQAGVMSVRVQIGLCRMRNSPSDGTISVPSAGRCGGASVSGSRAGRLRQALVPSEAHERPSTRADSAIGTMLGSCCFQFEAKQQEIRSFPSCGEWRSLRLWS